MPNLFVEPLNMYRWKDIKSFFVRSQYNELLKFVTKEYFDHQYTNGNLPRFLDTSRCLTLVRPDENCNCEVQSTGTAVPSVDPDVYKEISEAKALAQNTVSLRKIAAQELHFEWENLAASDPALQIQIEQKGALKVLIDAIREKKDTSAEYDAVIKALTTGVLKDKLTGLKIPVEKFKKSVSDATSADTAFKSKESEFDKKRRKAQLDLDIATERFNMADSAYQLDNAAEHEKKKSDAHIDMIRAKQALGKVQMEYQLPVTGDCMDIEKDYFCAPHFFYKRKTELTEEKYNELFQLQTTGLTVGALYWLYEYECMGIFKIHGVLVDDYNYKGQYTISGNRTDSNGLANRYSTLMDLMSTLHRLGISSNYADRCCTYQRVLGLCTDNPKIVSARNTGILKTIIDFREESVEYYGQKRLQEAIQTGIAPRSSVATQTSILDTMTLLKQQFEPFQYGRNQINTFLGIATVHATLCALYMLRKEIGIPDQYETPGELVPAAYMKLVEGKPPMLNEVNRFIHFDNRAACMYKLLTDIELLDISQFNVSATGSSLTKFLDDIESTVEGLKNASGPLSENAGVMYMNQ